MESNFAFQVLLKDFCYCCCLPLLPGFASSIHASWGPFFSRALYDLQTTSRTTEPRKSAIFACALSMISSGKYDISGLEERRLNANTRRRQDRGVHDVGGPDGPLQGQDRRTQGDRETQDRPAEGYCQSEDAAKRRPRPSQRRGTISPRPSKMSSTVSARARAHIARKTEKSKDGDYKNCLQHDKFRVMEVWKKRISSYFSPAWFTSRGEAFSCRTVSSFVDGFNINMYAPYWCWTANSSE